MWSHTWSLAIEEHFYILLPVLLSIVSTKPKYGKDAFRIIPRIFLLIDCVCLGLRLEKSGWPFQSVSHFFMQSHLRADTLFFGVLIAYYYNYRYEDFKKTVLFIRPLGAVIAGGLFLLPAFIFRIQTSPIMSTLGLSWFYVGCGLVLVGFLMMEFKNNGVLDLMSFVGRHSYSIYLWHLPFKMLSDYSNHLYRSGVLYFFYTLLHRWWWVSCCQSL